MKTENDFLLGLLSCITDNGINQEVCSFIFDNTAITHGNNTPPMIPLTEGAIQICQGIYGVVIGEMCMGYPIAKTEAKETIEDITNLILLCNKG